MTLACSFGSDRGPIEARQAKAAGIDAPRFTCLRAEPRRPVQALVAPTTLPCAQQPPTCDSDCDSVTRTASVFLAAQISVDHESLLGCRPPNEQRRVRREPGRLRRRAFPLLIPPDLELRTRIARTETDCPHAVTHARVRHQPYRPREPVRRVGPISVEGALHHDVRGKRFWQFAAHSRRWMPRQGFRDEVRGIARGQT
jgi:hypothetical protein